MIPMVCFHINFYTEKGNIRLRDKKLFTYFFFLPRLVESGDFGIVGKPTEVEEEAALKAGRTAILAVTSGTASKSKGNS